MKNLLKMFNPVELDKTKLEFGEAYTYKIFENDKCEISFLKLLPNSKIKKHTHIYDSEIYFFINEGTYSVCKKGESHELNNSSTEEMYVLSIKTKI